MAAPSLSAEGSAPMTSKSGLRLKAAAALAGMVSLWLAWRSDTGRARLEWTALAAALLGGLATWE